MIRLAGQLRWVVSALAIGAVPIAAAPASQRSVILGSDVLPGVEKLRAMDVTPARQPISVGIELARNETAIGRLIWAQYTPGNPLYHQFLDADGFNRRFGVPPARLRAAEAWARAGGLRVRAIAGATDYFLAAGSARQVAGLLHVRFSDYGDGKARFYANVNAPVVPAGLGIASISGLNDLEHPHVPRVVEARVSLPHAVSERLRTGAPDPGMATGLTQPADLWSIYDQPPNNEGQGQSMAIFGWGTTNQTLPDLRSEENEFGLPAIDYRISYYGTETSITDETEEGEWDLDTQAATGMAPDATALRLYFGKAGTDPDLVAAYNAWVNDETGPLQGSSSFLSCEEAPGTDGVNGAPGGLVTLGNPDQDQYTAALEQAVAEGRTMFAATGDTGSGCPAINQEINGYTLVPTPMQAFPAVSPYAVGVGGTVLFWDHGSAGSSGQPATRAFEYAWPFSGGGSSPVLAAGAYQTGFSPPILLFRCPVDNHGSPYPSLPPPLCRGVPDVAAQAGDALLGNGYSMTSAGVRGSFGAGTSLSSPLWLGMWTRIQAASTHTSSSGVAGNGFADPALYSTATGSAGSSPDFFDVGGSTAGDTAPTCNGPQPWQCSRPGWDYVSGLGTPNVSTLMKTLDGGTAPVHPTKPKPVPPPPLGPPPPPPISCGPLWQDASVDEQVPNLANPVTTGASPQLDLTSGRFSLSPDGRLLTTTLRILDLNDQPAGGVANQYYMDFQYGGTMFFTEVEVEPTGAVYYSDGTGSTSRTEGPVDTGTYNPGPGGTVTVSMPVSALAANADGLPAPAARDLITGIEGISGVLEGLPANAPVSGGRLVLADVDQAAAAYQLSATCSDH